MKTPAVLSMLLISLFSAFLSESAVAENIASRRSKADKLFKDGNYAEAYIAYKDILSGEEQNNLAAEDFSRAMDCLGQLEKNDEREIFRDKVVETFGKDWRLLWRAAQSYSSENPYGILIGGKFIRGGGYRRSGRHVNSFQRDRVRALQLFSEARNKSTSSNATKKERSELIFNFASNIMLLTRGETWRLQELTDLSVLPEYEEGGGYYGGGRRGAPVRDDGSPVFYSIPANFAEARSDGERWRFLLDEASQLNPDYRKDALLTYASFLKDQFDVHTLMDYGFLGYPADNSEYEHSKDANPYAVITLGEDETIAKLATGIKRFKLPLGHDYIRILRDLSMRDDDSAKLALLSLADIFKNRRQYEKAVECLKDAVSRFGKGNKELHQIIDDCGEFLPTSSLSALESQSLRIRYRNAKFAEFEARAINTELLIKDIKDYVRSNPKELKWEKLDLRDIGMRIINNDEDKYVGKKIAEWQVGLNPREGHQDRVQNIEMPFSKAGGYLISARFGEGNISRITLWLNDSVIVRKPGGSSMIYFCADSITGKPVQNAKLDFFAYKLENVDEEFWKMGRRQNIICRSFEAKTNSDGISVINEDQVKTNENLLVTMKSESGAISYMGFDGIWFMKYRYDIKHDGLKAYTITDRPAYRPGQEVKFKVWLANSKYENLELDNSEFAGTQVRVTVMDSFGEKIYESDLSADRWGGVSGEFPLKKDCHLGYYNISVKMGASSYYGGSNFRVEEYKKPEFEVIIEKPSEPVALGEKITAKVKANYYFGAAVSNAKVKYKVERYEQNEEWFYPHRWDWLYGRGYWWQSPDYEWYPGWSEWATFAPRSWWMPYSSKAPELVIENEVEIGEDGSVAIEIDS
nr:MG2 domain-containing protein [Victivallales bacterium]